MKRTIWFDMDGTIADLYGVDGWLPMLIASDPTPYAIAGTLVNMNVLARKLHKLQAAGWKVGIISWLSKNSTPEYDRAVTAAKIKWLRKHLKSVQFDAVQIVTYGTPKHTLGSGILFDDEEKNRTAWGDGAHTPDEIMQVLSSLLA